MRVHDFHPPISASGLFWTVRIPDQSATFAADGSSASVEVRDLAIVDQPRFPERAPTVRGTLAYMRVTWKSKPAARRFGDPGKQFVFDGHDAESQMEFDVRIPGINYVWKSDPLDRSHAKFAIVGKESNGRYHSIVMPDLAGLTETQALAILGNANVTNVTTEVLGHETLGNAYKHDLTKSVVAGTEPVAGRELVANARVVLHVRE
ncbi:MAG: hypothetical protein NVS3B16_11250 [Vulcanimicrobiaceae bacterium]